MIPAKPKPAWVQDLQDSQALLKRYVATHGPQRLGSEIFFTVDSVAYAAVAEGAHVYTVIGPGGEAKITASAPLTEPAMDAPAAEWDAYLAAGPAFHAAVRAAGI